MLALRKKRTRIRLVFKNTGLRVAVCCMLFSSAVPALAQHGQAHAASTRVPNADQMLKEYGIGLSEPELIAALSNPKAEVRVLAARKLALDKDKDAIPSIENALSVETSDTNRLNMAEDLAELGDPKGAGLLMNTCSDPTAPGNLRVLAAQDSLLLGKKDCLPYVLSVAQNDTEEVNRQAALSLLPQYYSDSEQAPDQVLKLLTGLLKDNSGLVRLESAIELGKLGNSQQAAALENAISQEPEAAIRQQMERTLKTLRSRSSK